MAARTFRRPRPTTIQRRSKRPPWQPPGVIEIRAAEVSDAGAIAAVHVASWQVAYRGLLPESVLTGLSVAGREQMWSAILAPPPSGSSKAMTERCGSTSRPDGLRTGGARWTGGQVASTSVSGGCTGNSPPCESRTAGDMSLHRGSEREPVDGIVRGHLAGALPRPVRCGDERTGGLRCV